MFPNDHLCFFTGVQYGKYDICLSSLKAKQKALIAYRIEVVREQAC